MNITNIDNPSGYSGIGGPVVAGTSGTPINDQSLPVDMDHDIMTDGPDAGLSLPPPTKQGVPKQIGPEFQRCVCPEPVTDTVRLEAVSAPSVSTTTSPELALTRSVALVPVPSFEDGVPVAPTLKYETDPPTRKSVEALNMTVIIPEAPLPTASDHKPTWMPLAT